MSGLGPVALNPRQMAAVTSAAKTTIVSACPGAGKTATLVARVVHLLMNFTAPCEITVTTFTRKAAGELRRRIAAALPYHDITDLTICTLHALAHRILVEHGEPRYRAGLAVVAPQEREEIIKRLVAVNQMQKVKAIVRLVEDIVTRDVDQATYAAATKEEYFALRIVTQYRAHLVAQNAVDLDIMVSAAAGLLVEHPGIDVVDGHLLVDEGQDLSADQWALIEAIGAQALFLVADADQAIYGWRGGDVGKLLALATQADVDRHDLVENYRSQPGIVRAASSLIRRNAARLDTEMIAARPTYAEHVAVEVVPFEFPADEVAHVASAIHYRIDAGGEKPGSIAVLARTNALLEHVERALLAEGILTHRPLRQARVWDAPTMKWLAALLRLHVNLCDERALADVLAWPEPAVSDADMARLQLAQHVSGELLVKLVAKEIKSTAAGRLLALLITCTRGGVSFDLLKPAEFLTGLLASEMHILLDVKPSIDVIADWQAGDVYASIDSFLSWYAARYVEEDQAEKLDAVEAVTLATVHGAKGLEWPTVFVIGCEQGLFPTSSEARSTAGIEESRRLFYVAMTRARDSLMLTLCAARNAWSGGASPFLSELELEHANISPELTVEVLS